MHEPDWRIFVFDILRAIANIEAFAQGYDATALAADTMRLHAVVFDLSIVGEALKRLDAVRPDLTAGLPVQQAWSMRNRLIHGYAQIDPSLVFGVIRDDLPALKKALEPLDG
ncbi:MAG: HepT-like ribonuclease domain-containing protein [Alphaproteobacteria bacterium]|jgi:uncharacterized protein with HEPN domain